MQQVLQAMEAEIAERERAATALANKNAELQSELRRRLAESESFNRVLVSLLQKTVLDQVLDIVCSEAQGLIGATGSAVLLLTDQAWLEVRHRLGKPLAAVEPVPVDGSLAGQVVRQGAPVLLNDPALFERAQVYQWPTDLSVLLAVPLHVNGGVIGVLDVVNKAGGFTEEDVPVLSVFANQAAMAIEHARCKSRRSNWRCWRSGSVWPGSCTISHPIAVQRHPLRRRRGPGAGRGQGRCHGRLLAGVAGDGAGGDARHAAADLPVAPTGVGDGRAGGRLAGAPGGRRGPRRPANRVPRQGRTAPADRDRERPVLDRPGGAQQRAQTCGSPACGRASPLQRASIILQVLDDGVGFDPQTAPDQGRGGLLTIAERSARIGGVLIYDSTPGKGTRVRLRWRYDPTRSREPPKRACAFDCRRPCHRAQGHPRPLSEVGGFEVLGVADNGQAAVLLAEETQPVRDFDGPADAGCGWHRGDARDHQPPAEISHLVLTSFVVDNKVFPAIKAGASG